MARIVLGHQPAPSNTDSREIQCSGKSVGERLGGRREHRKVGAY